MASETTPKPKAKPAAKRRPPEGETVYVVQARKSEAGVHAWTDIDCITVPAGTKRATVWEKARALDFGLEVGDRAAVRLIPAEFAEPEFVAMVQPPAQLVIGTLPEVA